jgi:CubicO group peptidase (beta-lactamase class C family)
MSPLALVALGIVAATAVPGAELQRSTPEAEQLDAGALKALVSAAEASSSDALVVLRNGKLVGEWYFGKPRGPIEAMSTTKSVVGLVIGKLIDDGKLKSLDQPVHELFPELPDWNKGRKARITLRHLLEQSSGIKADRNTKEIYASTDFVKLALAADISTEPGATFFYNNKAVNLLAGVVERATGRKLDEVARDALFAPLGIVDTRWEKDRAGNPHAMSGLQIHPVDLAKLGQLVLDRGRWRGKQLLGEAWIDAMSRGGVNPGYGLLWWLKPAWAKSTVDDALLAQWKAGGAPADLLTKMATLKGRVLSHDDYEAEVEKLFGGRAGMQKGFWEALPRPTVERKLIFGPIVGIEANGYLGQFVEIVPAARLVAVRMRRQGDGEQDNDPAKGLARFSDLVRALVTAP